MCNWNARSNIFCGRKILIIIAHPRAHPVPQGPTQWLTVSERTLLILVARVIIAVTKWHITNGKWLTAAVKSGAKIRHNEWHHDLIQTVFNLFFIRILSKIMISLKMQVKSRHETCFLRLPANCQSVSWLVSWSVRPQYWTFFLSVGNTGLCLSTRYFVKI